MKSSERFKPWVEKYRPKGIDDVAHQDEVVAVLKKSFINQDLPNLLFYGPPGTGKTSTILAMAREMFGSVYKERVLELNASDERGISVIREKVKNFSQIAVSGFTPDGKPCPTLKLIILDEADSMTNAAQAALRRVMEKESKTTRFCLICNYISRIIEPITSRCAKFRFKPLPQAILQEKLGDICKAECLTIEKKALCTLIEVSNGDMRKAVTTLQTVARMKEREEVSCSDVIEISGIIHQKDLNDLLNVCRSGSMTDIEAKVKEFILDGNSVLQFLFQLHDMFVTSDDFNDVQKSLVCEKISVVDKCLLDGADEELQLFDLCTAIMQAMNSSF